VLSLVGIYHWPELRPRAWDVERVEWQAMLIAALMLGMVVASVPIYAAAWERAGWWRRRRLNDPSLPARPLPVNATVVAAALILALPAFFQIWDFGIEWWDEAYAQALWTGATLLAFLMATAYALRFLYLGLDRTRLLMALWYFMVWIGPVVADLTRAGVMDLNEDEYISGMTGASPIGALLFIWSDWRKDYDARPGIVAQAVFVLLLAIVYALLSRRVRKSPVAEAPPSGVRPAKPLPASSGS
jgi:hypothetical protein